MIELKNLTAEGIRSLQDVFYRSITVDQMKITFQGLRYDEIVDASIPAHTHNFFEFHYLLAGNVKTTVNNMARIYGPGQCYLMPPAAVHKHECILPDNFYHGITIRWELQQVRQEIFNPGLDGIYMALWRSQGEIINDADGSICKEMNEIVTLAQCGVSHMELLVRLAGLVLNIGRHCFPFGKEKRRLPVMPKAAETILQKAISFIENHCTEAITPAHVTASIPISYSHLARLFSQYLHTSISQYILRVKIDRALHLLVSTEMGVNDIAKQVGFSSPSHFSRTFKEMVGYSPGRYLKYIKENRGNGDFGLL